jgi:hypothetical protein
MAYINETLGINCKSTLNNGILLFDPHGLGGDDNFILSQVHRDWLLEKAAWMMPKMQMLFYMSLDTLFIIG